MASNSTNTQDSAAQKANVLRELREVLNSKYPSVYGNIIANTPDIKVSKACNATDSIKTSYICTAGHIHPPSYTDNVAPLINECNGMSSKLQEASVTISEELKNSWLKMDAAAKQRKDDNNDDDTYDDMPALVDAKEVPAITLDPFETLENSYRNYVKGSNPFAFGKSISTPILTSPNVHSDSDIINDFTKTLKEYYNKDIKNDSDEDSDEDSDGDIGDEYFDNKDSSMKGKLDNLMKIAKKLSPELKKKFIQKFLKEMLQFDYPFDRHHILPDRYRENRYYFNLMMENDMFILNQDPNSPQEQMERASLFDTILSFNMVVSKFTRYSEMILMITKDNKLAVLAKDWRAVNIYDDHRLAYCNQLSEVIDVCQGTRDMEIEDMIPYVSDNMSILGGKSCINFIFITTEGGFPDYKEYGYELNSISERIPVDNFFYNLMRYIIDDIIVLEKNITLY
jgi:hypothetical protein